MSRCAESYPTDRNLTHLMEGMAGSQLAPSASKAGSQLAPSAEVTTGTKVDRFNSRNKATRSCRSATKRARSMMTIAISTGSSRAMLLSKHLLHCLQGAELLPKK